MMVVIMKSKMMCAVVTFFTFALLIQVSEEQPGCDTPEPLARSITDKDGAGTNLFVSRNTKGASYKFVFDPQHGKGSEYFNAYFKYILQDDIWAMQITKPLEISLISQRGVHGIVLTVLIYCTGYANNKQPSVPFARLINVRRTDEFDPVFTDERMFNVREDAPVDSLVARMDRLFTDKDFNGKPSIVYYFVTTKYEGKSDGSQIFKVTNEGETILTRPLDYEMGDITYKLGVVAHAFFNQTAKAFVEARVINLNDNPPIFAKTGCLTKCNTSYYSATVPISFVGPLTTYAFGPIQAVDADGDAAEYSFLRGSPEGYQSYVAIDKQSGSLRILKAFASLNQSLKYVEIQIQAKSVSTLNRSRTQNVTELIETSIQLWPTYGTVEPSISYGCLTEPANVVLFLPWAFALIGLTLCL